MSDQSIVEVTQADRDAAADYMAEVSAAIGTHDPIAMAFMDEACDGMMIVQAFARHRIAEREACAMVAEKYGGDYESATSPVCRARRNIAAAIRGRSDRVDDISYAGVK